MLLRGIDFCPNPVCGEDDIDCFDNESVQDRIYHKYTCFVCGCYWEIVYDYYSLTNFKLADE